MAGGAEAKAAAAAKAVHAPAKAKAKAAGMSKSAYANKVLAKGSKASTLTKRQASFYKTLRKIASKRKKK